MRIVINGVDWSSDINPYSIHPFHEKRQGVNAGFSMSGSKIFDTVSVKQGFSCVAGLLTQERYSALVALAKLDTVTVAYDDPDTNESVVREMTITAERPTQIPLLGGGYMYKNLPLTFLER